MPAPLDEELHLAAENCREASASPEFVGLNAIIPSAPRNAEGWFDLLAKYDEDPKAVAALMRMRRALPAELAAAGVSIERYSVLKALAIAVSRVASKAVPRTVIRFYAEVCTEIASKSRQWDSHFDMEGSPERFFDIAQLATLRRFPAGSLNFTFERLQPLHAMFFVHPLSLPGYLYQRIAAMPFTKPSIAPHVNFGRKQSLILTQTDYERGLWLIAKTVEMNPKVNGINGWSWFYSKTVGEAYPHLAWLRAIVSDGGAYLVDTFPAEPDRYGFAYNNRKRQILYEEGKFCPRQTAYFWPRDDFLNWASRHPELIPDGEEPVLAPQRRTLRFRSPKPARHAKRNSSITLWNGKAALKRFGQYEYAALVLFLPAFMLSLAVLLIAGSWSALLAFPVCGFLAFAFQYYFSQ